MKVLLSRDCCRDFLSISFPATRKCDRNRQPYPAAKDIILVPVVRRRGSDLTGGDAYCVLGSLTAVIHLL
jgi:hypothetical protein